mgnify:CR=1 FL=1
MAKNYPKPTNDFDKAKDDLKVWGYCLFLDSIPKIINENAKQRLLEQAQAEKKLNLAFEDGSNLRKWGEFKEVNLKDLKTFNSIAGGINQRVWMLPNKGNEFLKILDNHNYFKIMQLIVGEHPIVSSFGANIAKKGGIPMDLHTDQWWAPEPIDRKKDFLPSASITRKKFNYEINKNVLNNNDMIARPAVSNVLIMMNGMTFENGGTMVVPGSHLFGRHPEKELDTEIKPIAAEGPPGCAIITDGRLWHGTGANITEEPRIAIIITFCGPQYRPQENYTYGLKKEVLKKLNDFQKELLGFRVWNGYGRTGDPTQDFIDSSEESIGILKN